MAEAGDNTRGEQPNLSQREQRHKELRQQKRLALREFLPPDLQLKTPEDHRVSRPSR